MSLRELVSGPLGMLRLSAAISVFFAFAYWFNVKGKKNGKTTRSTEAPDPLSPDWTEIGRVTELYYYPLKSGRGKPIGQCDFTDFGISFAEDGLFTLKDRMFLVYSEKSGEFQTGRSYSNLVLLNIYSVDEWSVGLEASGMPSLVFRIPETAIRRLSDEVECSMWFGERVKCIDCGAAPAAWISKFLTGTEDSDLRLGAALPARRNILKGPWERFTKVYTTLRNEDTGYFSDITSYMLMNEASLGELNKRLDRAVKCLQLRPNIVVSGCEPFAEDSWEWIKIGESVVLRNVKPCPRCAMVRIDPETAEVDPLEPLKTLRSFREQKDPERVDVDGKAPTLGIYCGLYRAGPISKTPEERVEIIGKTGVAAAWGFNYYIKNYCNSHVAWEGARVEIPVVLPEVQVTVTSNDRFRYYQNVCTAGYSSAWWKWEQWEKNIDWMALNGINLALAFHAQEAIWLRVYKEMGLSLAEINQHFGGPAFLPWSRMGNIRGWGGPLTPSWHQHTIDLQHRILDRMRELGIVPVLPAFAGHVPRAFTRIHPEANVTKIDTWNKFDEPYCCPYLLSPTDPLFKTVGGKFLQTYIDEFGTDHIYNCDTFNENEPQDSELASLRNFGQAVFAAMTDVDPQAIWLMQGWLFVHDLIFWTEPRIKAFITSVPIGRMIVLDLQSEQFPQYARLQSYYGQPFIWCMLHNFGGTLGMFGSAEIINKRPFGARAMNGSTMVGTGLTPEGINQNYVIYELMNEMAYRKKPVKLDSWFEEYAIRRYGVWNEYAIAAWQILSKTVYNFNGIQRIRGHYVITRRPRLDIKTWTWYDREDFFHAWDNITKAHHGRSNSSFYRHDLVDITRQALQLKADYIYDDLIEAYSKKNKEALSTNVGLLGSLFDDLEKILASSENFLVGKWLRDAKALATVPEEEANYEYNARNQITLWGPKGEIRDYANKQWSGVVADYFSKRWLGFTQLLMKSLEDQKAFNGSFFDEWAYRNVEEPFTMSKKIYHAEPRGDCIKIAVELNEKWRKLVKPRKGRSEVSRSRKIRHRG